MELDTEIPLLQLGSDLGIRYQWFTRESLGHPAKLHLGLLQYLLDHYTAPGQTIIDPMGGIGSTLYAATQQRNVILREIEPRWLALAYNNAANILVQAGMFAGSIDIGQHDARQPWGIKGDVVLFSPPYACAVASTPTAKGMSSHQMRARLAKLGSYNEAWDRLIQSYENGATGVAAAYLMHYGQHPSQVGHFRGARYWQAMGEIYTQARASLDAGGLMILVIKDHIRRGERVCVAAETITLCDRLGFRLVDRVQRHVFPLSLWQRRRKERGEIIVEAEDALILEAI